VAGRHAVLLQACRPILGCGTKAASADRAEPAVTADIVVHEAGQPHALASGGTTAADLIRLAVENTSGCCAATPPTASARAVTGGAK
jgi:hypothetical protein